MNKHSVVVYPCCTAVSITPLGEYATLSPLFPSFKFFFRKLQNGDQPI